MTIRVLVVDTSARTRRIILESLQADPEMASIASINESYGCFDRIEEYGPDVVLLDQEMSNPERQLTLSALRRQYPLLPIIVFGRGSQTGIDGTVSALTLGADAYVARPSDVASTPAWVQDELIPKIKSVTARRSQPKSEVAMPTFRSIRETSLQRRTRSAVRIQAIAIAASTGGPDALLRILSRLPVEWATPLLIVQHMPAPFMAGLAQRLGEQTGLDVREAHEGARLTQAQAWLCPGDHHLLIRREGGEIDLELSQAEPINSCRPSADLLFRTAAEVFGPEMIAIVLTGMGRDGLNGAEAVRASGGIVIAQDEASSVVWGMPGVVARAGIADLVLPLDQIGPEIVIQAGGRPQ